MGVATLVAASLSLLWWRTEADRWLGHYCPDGYCAYADRLRAALFGGGPAARRQLAEFVDSYMHAHNPLAPLLQAPLALVTPHPLLAYMVVSAAASLYTCLAVWRLAARAGARSAWLSALLPAALATHVLVVQAFARPMTDALGMAATVSALWALERHRATRSMVSGTVLFAVQVLGLHSRVSFIPVLGMPVLAALADAGPWRGRLGDALRAGIFFGFLPGLLFLAGHTALGTLHLDLVWQFAHRAEFVQDHTWRSGLTSLMLAIQGYSILLVVSASPSLWRNPTTRLHLLWIALYLAFLGFGGGSLQPRYFVSIVPSVLVVAVPAVAELEARRPWNARVLLVLCIVANLLYVVPVTHDVRAAARLLRHDFPGGLAGPPVPAGYPPVDRAELILGASGNSTVRVSWLTTTSRRDGRPFEARRRATASSSTWDGSGPSAGSCSRRHSTNTPGPMPWR